MAQSLVGFHAIAEYLGSMALRKSGIAGNILYVAVNPGPRVKQLIELGRSLRIAVQSTDDKTLAQLSGNADHRGAVLVFPSENAPTEVELDFTTILADLAARIVQMADSDQPVRQPLVLALDSITDPHNLGAILRSADKFGVDLVLIPQRRSAQENETVRKSSAGASAWVKSVVVSNLHRALLACREQGFWICGADMDGTVVSDFDANCPIVLVMGSEGKGIGRLVRECCDSVISIPCSGHVDSLNVSVATGILLYEIRRQQGFIG